MSGRYHVKITGHAWGVFLPRTEGGYEFDTDNIAKIKKLCHRRHLHMTYSTDFSKRSSDYRKTFYETYPGLFGKDIWLCAYCGRPLSRKTLTVDHLYPVAKARNERAEKRLKKKGYEDINDPRNLVPACERCNKKKGQKTGRWIIKGYIGRHQKVRFALNIAKILLIVLLFLFVLRLGSMPQMDSALITMTREEYEQEYGKPYKEDYAFWWRVFFFGLPDEYK